MDPSTEEGLIDLTLLSNLLTLLLFLNPRHYAAEEKDQVPAMELVERQHLISTFLQFQTTFTKHQRLEIDGRLHAPQSAFFDPFFIQICITLCKYREIMHEFAREEGVTIEELTHAIGQHIHDNHPSLYDAFLADLEKPTGDLPYMKSFSWTGPSFTVVSRQDLDSGEGVEGLDVNDNPGVGAGLASQLSSRKRPASNSGFTILFFCFQRA
jgi:hypothetical protein